jgi:hypothetical protein
MVSNHQRLLILTRCFGPILHILNGSVPRCSYGVVPYERVVCYFWLVVVSPVGQRGVWARSGCLFVCDCVRVVVCVVLCGRSGSLCMLLVVLFSTCSLSSFPSAARRVSRRPCGGILLVPGCGVFRGGGGCCEMWIFLHRALFLGCIIFLCVIFRVSFYFVGARILMRVSREL